MIREILINVTKKNHGFIETDQNPLKMNDEAD